jgi:hypothetical protein
MFLCLCACAFAVDCFLHLEVGDDFAVAAGEFEDGGAAGFESRHFLAREYVIEAPVLGLLEDAGYTSCYGR